jgi:tetratricopeptide (TPR) repeat protein
MVRQRGVMTVTGRFWDNPHFVRYEELLRQLHTLMAVGDGDSDDAERVREAMDEPGRRLSAEEIDRLNWLSADLYLIEDDERLQADPSGGSPEMTAAALNAAIRLQQWEQVLALLRLRSPLSAPDRVALQRAAAYRHLGHIDVAILFLKYAAGIKPEVAEYEWALVELLLEARRFDEADPLALAWTRRSGLPPVLAIRAAALLVETARNRLGEPARAIFMCTIELLQRTLPQSSDLPAVFVVLGYLLLGHCYQQLGQPGEAYRVYDEGLRVYGDDPGLYAARGSLRVETDPSAAIADFQRAVAGGARLALPYIYVAHDALLRGEYQRCLDLCERILSLSQNGRVLAAALQWMAIARFEMRASVESVRQLFEAALDFDPLNEQIQQNLGIFQQLSQAESQERDPEARWSDLLKLDPTLVSPELRAPHFQPLAA